MILSKKPMAIAEVIEYVKNLEGKEELLKELKKFSKISKDKSHDLMIEIEGLNNPKIKEEHIVKLSDFVPKDKVDVNKILLDSNLNDEEANAIAEIIGKY